MTGQHKELLADLIDFFKLDYDLDLKVMKPNQTLVASFIEILNGLNTAYQHDLPELIFVQGDTSSAFAGALFCYSNLVKVVHVKAGLRCDNIWSPFPEEENRKLIAQVASFHFCATNESVQNLKTEKHYRTSLSHWKHGHRHAITNLSAIRKSSE